MDRYFSVLSHRRWQTDRQTDRWTQTDSFLVTRPPCIQCTAVKIGPKSKSNADFLIWNHYHSLINNLLQSHQIFNNVLRFPTYFQSNKQFPHIIHSNISIPHSFSSNYTFYTFSIHSITILTVSISYLLIYYFPVHLLGLPFYGTFFNNFFYFGLLFL